MMGTTRLPVSRYKRANVPPLIICRMSKAKLSINASFPLKKALGFVWSTANNSVERNVPTKISPLPTETVKAGRAWYFKRVWIK